MEKEQRSSLAAMSAGGTLSRYPALAGLALLLGLAGCALSPQVVDINPVVKAADTVPAASGAALALQVVDTRGSSVIGHRGGVYSRTATISTAEDVTGSIRRSLTAALTAAGYRVVEDDTTPALRVEIARLDYTVREGKLTRIITTVARLNAVYSKGNKTYTNSYTVTRNTEVLTAPGAVRNAELINSTLTAAFQRLLGDSQLFGLINGG
jgi:uncharacterized lipoprotein